MASTFEVTPFHEQGDKVKYHINPLNVVLVRPVWREEELHVLSCDRSVTCPLSGIEGGDDVIFTACEVGRGEEFAELLFVNSLGAQSALVVKESVAKIKERWNEGLRGTR